MELHPLLKIYWIVAVGSLSFVIFTVISNYVNEAENIHFAKSKKHLLTNIVIVIFWPVALGWYIVKEISKFWRNLPDE